MSFKNQAVEDKETRQDDIYQLPRSHGHGKEEKKKYDKISKKSKTTDEGLGD